jgi:hypothetical protein
MKIFILSLLLTVAFFGCGRETTVPEIKTPSEESIFPLSVSLRIDSLWASRLDGEVYKVFCLGRGENKSKVPVVAYVSISIFRETNPNSASATSRGYFGIVNRSNPQVGLSQRIDTLLVGGKYDWFGTVTFDWTGGGRAWVEVAVVIEGAKKKEFLQRELFFEEK